MTSLENFDLDLAQEYQISQTGDLDSSSQSYPQNQLSEAAEFSQKQNANIPFDFIVSDFSLNMKSLNENYRASNKHNSNS